MGVAPTCGTCSCGPEGKLREALRSEDADRIDAACDEAESSGVNGALVAEGRSKSSRLRVLAIVGGHGSARGSAPHNLAEGLTPSGDASHMVACGDEPLSSTLSTGACTDDSSLPDLSRARSSHSADAELAGPGDAQQRLREALRSGHVRRIEESCAAAEASGAPGRLVVEGRAEARRLRALMEGELREVLGSGRPARIERKVREAAMVGVEGPLVDECRADLLRLQSLAELNEALESQRADQISKACKRAEAAGLDKTLIRHAQVETRRLKSLEAGGRPPRE